MYLPIFVQRHFENEREREREIAKLNPIGKNLEKCEKNCQKTIREDSRTWKNNTYFSEISSIRHHPRNGTADRSALDPILRVRVCIDGNNANEKRGRNAWLRYLEIWNPYVFLSCSIFAFARLMAGNNCWSFFPFFLSTETGKVYVSDQARCVSLASGLW